MLFSVRFVTAAALFAVGLYGSKRHSEVFVPHGYEGDYGSTQVHSFTVDVLARGITLAP
jgi:hypothetical protein